MKNLTTILLSLFVLYSCNSSGPGDNLAVPYYPPIEPYDTGHLHVSELHTIYYEICGNPKGETVFVLHGGPGGGCSPLMRQYFDPEKFRIVLHDQRGAGRSKPYAEIRENTTWDLVEDIETLRKKTGSDDILLFGGSWGSTLALAYAETYPDHVSGMILRGIWTSTQEEIDHFYHGGVAKFYPDAYKMLLNALPDPKQRPLPSYMLSLLQTDDVVTKNEYAKVWAAYEISVSSIYSEPGRAEKIFDYFDPYAFALIENHYMANHCFMEEGQLFKNIDRIKDIPCTIINGRYDMPCPPRTAYKLHNLLPRSQLHIVAKAGHHDDEIARALLKAVKDFE